MAVEITNNEQGNDLIKHFIKKMKPFLIGRVGLTEILVSYLFDTNLDYKQMLPLLSNNAGVYGNSYENFFKEYISSISNCDAQVFWDIEYLHLPQEFIFGKYNPSSQLLGNRSVEPFYFTSPWSSQLSGKKVLVISPFSDTIQTQYTKRNLLWDNKEILPEFELITYKSIQSIGNMGPHNNWQESLNHMKSDISKLEFDIALLGCGAYGMPLGNFIKTELNKSAIYVGGGLQILFGIKGSRWDTHEVGNFYNDNWIRPSDSEKPKAYISVENGCYW